MGKLVTQIFLWLLCSKAWAIESPEFELKLKDGDFELRRYSAHLQAVVRVKAPFAEAGNQGFRPLADFIFGKNQTRSSIAMTAPVGQSPSSEEIAMTAPVGMQAEQESYLISFTMPKKYNAENLPVPLNPEVEIREVSSYTAAVLGYSGTWSQERFEQKRDSLRQWMQTQKLTPRGEAVFARYDPPWMPWFLRRNEVIWTVELENSERQAP